MAHDGEFEEIQKPDYMHNDEFAEIKSLLKTMEADIYHTFISKEAPKEVNLPSKVFAGLHKAHAEGECNKSINCK